MSRFPLRTTLSVLLLWLSVLLAGCSTTPQYQGPVLPAQKPVSEFVKPDQKFFIHVYDPLERFNRNVYYFNANFDRYIFLPVVNTYQWITPDLVEQGVSNFFKNIDDITNLLNAMLQLKPEQSGQTLARLVFNSTIGILGLWDPATAMGIPRHQEDFGQTLGYYGLGPGPFLVLPILGPSNLRDTAGLVVDFGALNAIDPLQLNNHQERELIYSLMRAIDQRRSVDFRYYKTGSPFEYDLVRVIYTRYRELRIAK